MSWESRGQRAVRRAVGWAFGIAVIVGLVAAAMEMESGPVDTTPVGAETAKPTGAPGTEVLPDQPTLAQPFRGSPALRWADGAAGIETPPAKAVGWMSKSQVAAAVKSTEQFLVAANLDPATIKGDKPAAALALLDPTQPGGRPALEKALLKPTEEQDPTLLFSRFNPSEVWLVGDVVKTRGRMTVEKGTGENEGEVLIRTDYTFVYPIVKSRPGAKEVARTIVRREIIFGLADPAKFEVTKGKLWASEWSSHVGNDDCDRPVDGFFHPTFDEDGTAPPVVPAASGPVTDPYDRSQTLDELPQECGTSSRT